MKIFHAIRNKDSADKFISTLLSAGYQETRSLSNADFCLADCENGDGKRSALLKFSKSRPVFIYPHTPYSYFLWDGIIKPVHIACNFVVGDGAVAGMAAYGYPYRVEKIGWTGSPVNDFMRTSGTRLLFAPPHPLNNGKYPRPEQYDLVRSTAKFIADNLDAFERVVVSCSPHSIIESGLEDLVDHRVQWEEFDAYRSKFPRQHALSLIREADIVISSGTFGYVSVAYGAPTVMMGYRDCMPASNREGVAAHYDLYKSHFDYPLTIESMTIEEVLAVRTRPNESVEAWKWLNVGEPFDKRKFLGIIEGV